VPSRPFADAPVLNTFALKIGHHFGATRPTPLLLDCRFVEVRHPMLANVLPLTCGTR
jgi:hypothetical protein